MKNPGDPKRKTTPWTEEEQRRLLELDSQNDSLSQIKVDPVLAHRTTGSLNANLHQLRYAQEVKPVLVNQIPWTEEQKRYLIELDGQNVSMDLVMQNPMFGNRTHNSLRAKLHKLRLEGRNLRSFVAKPVWSKKEEVKLLKLYSLGYTWDVMTQHFPGRTCGSIEQRYWQLTKASRQDRLGSVPWPRLERNQLGSLWIPKALSPGLNTKTNGLYYLFNVRFLTHPNTNEILKAIARRATSGAVKFKLRFFFWPTSKTLK